MKDLIIIAVVALIVCGACVYIRKEKKKGVKCIGCPSAGMCNKNKCNIAASENVEKQ